MGLRIVAPDELILAEELARKKEEIANLESKLAVQHSHEVRSSPVIHVGMLEQQVLVNCAWYFT